MGAPVSDDESSVDYSLGNTPTESEGYFVSDNSYDGPYNSPSPASNIPPLSYTSPPNTSQEVYISREGSQDDPKRKY